MFKLLAAVVSLFVVNYSAVFSVFFLLHGGQITVLAQCYPEVIVVASDGATDDYFGAAVAIDGNNALCGSWWDDDLGDSSGSAYIFSEVSPGTWVQVAKLLPSDGAMDDWFGYAVDLDGTNAIMGCYFDDNVGADNSGSSYIFSEQSPGTWIQVAKLVPSDAALNDQAGNSVAISGTNALMGASLDDDLGEDSGSAYIFSEVSPGTWVQVAKLLASDGAADDQFGIAVAIDGTNALVGAQWGDAMIFASGAAYIFSEQSPGTWVQVAKLEASDGATDDHFGTAVAIDGTNALVGAQWDDAMGYNSGSAYIFSEQSPGTWVQVAKLVPSDGASGDYFSGSVALRGNNAVMGARNDDDGGDRSGSAYIFSQVSAGNWIQIDKLTASDGATDDYFGQAVSMSGTTVLVGARGAEAAYLYFLDDVDDCPGNACEHGATCIDAVYDYCCVCPPAYGGEFCTDCLCENGGVCQDDALGSGYCDCSGLPYSGNVCQKFCNNGVSETYPDTGCNCTLSGATGSSCNKDIDDCESSPCANGGTCSDYGADLFPNHAHEFNCSCGSDSPFMGPTCEDTLCYSSPCLHGGTCVNGEDFVCNCTAFYEGEFCQTEIDECASSPCLNDGDCTDLLGGFTCDCTGTGYEGLTCDVDVDDCASSPCENDGVCQDKGANKFKCTCDEFWEGDVCTDDVDDCILKGYYCENGAACTDDPVNMGDVMCDCSTSTGGFTGKYCNVPIEDACVTFNPCANGGKCILDDITKEMSCDCADTGYEGDVCDVQVYASECVSSPCLNEGQCYDPSDYQDDWYCVCVNGYFGDLCDVQACDSNPCQNAGTCTNDVEGSYTCTCAENYSGAQCQENEDEQVQQGSSSSSSSADNEENLVSDDDNDTAKNDGDMLIIIIIVVVVVVGAGVGGFLFYRKQQSAKTFTMPT